MEHLVEFVDWISAKHKGRMLILRCCSWKVVVACCCHWCQLVPFQSVVDVLSDAGIEESVKSFYLSIALWSVSWRMDRHFHSKLGDNFFEELVLEFSSIVCQDLHTLSKGQAMWFLYAVTTLSAVFVFNGICDVSPGLGRPRATKHIKNAFYRGAGCQLNRLNYSPTKGVAAYGLCGLAQAKRIKL